MGKPAELAGRRFGKLVAIEYTGEKFHGSYVWKCICDCGNTCEVPSQYLSAGTKRSCGCDKQGRTIRPGERFGELTAIRECEERIKREVYWECECSCGEICKAKASDLRNGRKKFCSVARHPTFTDLSGMRFGRLTAIEPCGKTSYNGNFIWKCVCDCGNTCEVNMRCLVAGHTRSCGCLASEKSARAVKKGRELVFIDETNIAKLSNKLPSNNKSGIKGVAFDKHTNKWRAYIGCQGKRYDLGSFDDIADAAEARREAEEKLFDPILEKHGLPATSEERYQELLRDAVKHQEERGE